MLRVLRREKKYLINLCEATQKDAYLANFLHADAHNGSRGYMIRSLYFDTAYDSDLTGKVEGLELRRKIRLRCYSPDAEFVKLEMKQKQGEQQLKRSLTLSREHAKLLCAGDYSPLREYSEPFAAECYGLMNYRCYQPRAVVEYKRKAYLARENNIRLTFDSDVRATESCFDIFSPKLMMNPVLDADKVVLEVKYNGFLLAYIKEMLGTVDKSELSVSKYYLARQQGYLTRI